MTTSARLGITELAATQNDRSVTVNEAIAKLEAGATFFAARQVLLNAPPGSPVEGDLYVVGTAGSGAWSGHSENVALYYNAAWLFFVPFEGMFAWDQNANSLMRYDGADWIAFTIGAGGIADGDYGDITVSSSGTVWTVDAFATHATEVGFAPTGMAHTTATNVEDALQDLDDAITAAASGAAGKQTIWVPASAMTPATTNGPATGQIETTTNKVNISVLDFDATTAEQAWFNVAFPKGWNESTVTFKVFWTSTATDTDGIAMSLAGISFADNETLDTALGTAVVVTDDAQSNSTELYVSAESSAVTIGGTPAEDELVAFRVQRVVSDGNDDMAEDMRLIGIKLFYTTDAANDA